MLGDDDEVWWSRLAQPSVHAWTAANRRLRLVEAVPAHDDPDPTALACSGLLTRWVEPDGQRHERLRLRFVDGRPVSAITTPFLAWCCERLAAQGKRQVLTAEELAARVCEVYGCAHEPHLSILEKVA